MTLTALGGVSNSGSKAFTNPEGTIAKGNYNRIVEIESTYSYPPYNYNRCNVAQPCGCNYRIKQNIHKDKHVYKEKRAHKDKKHRKRNHH